MSQESRIEVINRDGWRKEYPLQKGIIYIGSAPTNDIVLSGAQGVGVAPLHVQLIAGGEGGYKLVNLSDQDIRLGSAGDELLPPRAVVGMPDGTVMQLGEFTLVFRGGSGGYTEFSNGSGSRNIGLRLSLSQTRLAPHQILEGTAIIRNLGGKTGARFDVVLEGFDEDCFEIEPGPLLSSGAEKEISFRLYHRGDKPLAGEWTFLVRATSPKVYPGEQAQVYQQIEVLPLYRHQLRLLPAPGLIITSPPREAMTTPKSPLKGKETLVQARPQPEPEVSEDWVETPPEAEEAKPAQRTDVRRLKAKAVAATAVVAEAASTSEAERLWTAPTPTRAETPAPPVPPPQEGEEGEAWEVKVGPQPPPPPPAPAVTVTEEAEEWSVATKAPPPPPPPVITAEPEAEEDHLVEKIVIGAASVAGLSQISDREETTEYPVAQPAQRATSTVFPQPGPPPPAAEEVQPGPPGPLEPAPLPPEEVQLVAPAEAAPVDNWWTRLKGALFLSGRKTEATLPAATAPEDQSLPEPMSVLVDEPIEARPAVEEPIIVAQEEAVAATPLPTEAVEPIEARPVVEEPIIVPQEEAVAVTPPPSEAVEPIEVRPVIEEPIIVAQEEIVAATPPPSEAVEPMVQTPELWAEEPAPEPEANVPVAEVKPTSGAGETEDWWADKAEAVAPEPAAVAPVAAEPAAKVDDWWEEEPKEQPPAAIALSANPKDVVQEQPTATAVESPQEEDDLWGLEEAKPRTKTSSQPVIKLKANPSSVNKPESKAETPEEAEEWWAADREVSSEQTEKK